MPGMDAWDGTVRRGLHFSDGAWKYQNQIWVS